MELGLGLLAIVVVIAFLTWLADALAGIIQREL